MGTEAPYHHGTLRRALHDAALRLIAEHGADAFTMKRAAAEAGVSVAAPYRHYTGKADLLGALAAEGFELLAERLDEAARAAPDPAEALLDLGAAYLDFARDRPAHFEVMFNNRGREPRPAEGGAALEVLGEALARLDRAGLLAVPPNAALRATWSLVHGLAVLHHGGMRTLDQDDPRSLREEVLAPVLRGGLLRGHGA